MNPPDDTYLFDATGYAGFEKAKVLDARFRRPDWTWYKGLSVVIAFVFVIVWFVFSGIAADQPLALVIVVLVAAFIVIAYFLILFVSGDSPRTPVRVTADGRLILGERSLPVSRIGGITAFGNAGAVEIRENDGHVFAILYRAQFGSFDDFVQVLQRLRPDVLVVRDTTNVKVRMPKDSV